MPVKTASRKRVLPVVSEGGCHARSVRAKVAVAVLDCRQSRRAARGYPLQLEQHLRASLGQDTRRKFRQVVVELLQGDQDCSPGMSNRMFPKTSKANLGRMTKKVWRQKSLQTRVASPKNR